MSYNARGVTDGKAAASPGNCTSPRVSPYSRERRTAYAEGTVIHCMGFLERLSRLEHESAESEWRETWAGFLILRLYRLWHFEPQITEASSPTAMAVRSFVGGLPESVQAKDGFLRVLDALRGNGREQHTLAARLLREYAAGLIQQTHSAVAQDVHRTLAICCSGIDASMEPSGAPGTSCGVALGRPRGYIRS